MLYYYEETPMGKTYIQIMRELEEDNDRTQTDGYVFRRADEEILYDFEAEFSKT